MATRKKTEPLPCPFCGSKPLVGSQDWPQDTEHYVDCPSKRCPTNPGTCGYKTRAAAVRAWNRRAK